jgi:hypothetical protein
MISQRELGSADSSLFQGTGTILKGLVDDTTTRAGLIHEIWFTANPLSATNKSALSYEIGPRMGELVQFRYER